MASKANRKRSKAEDTGLDNVAILAAAAAAAGTSSKKTISANWSGSTITTRQLEGFQRAGLISFDIA